MRVEFLYIEGCPNVTSARTLLASCLAQLGLAIEIHERNGDHPSPTIRVNGIDVMGDPQVQGRACRLDVPTEERILAALRRAMTT